jgi:hypothetical protein
MTLELIRDALGWCALMNIAILLIWGLGFLLAHDRIYSMHRKFFKLTVEQFDAIHYCGMAGLKILFLVFSLIPYLALRIVG